MDLRNSRINSMSITVGEPDDELERACVQILIGNGAAIYIHGSISEIRSFAYQIMVHANAAEERQVSARLAEVQI